MSDTPFSPTHFTDTRNARRDNLAISCSEDELARRLPKTQGDIREEMRKRGFNLDPVRNYTYYSDKDMNRLRCLLRYEYADDMMAASYP